MLSGICFLGVNTILTIILIKNLFNGFKIDKFFLSALILTFLGNAFAFDMDNVLILANVFLSLINVSLGISEVEKCV